MTRFTFPWGETHGIRAAVLELARTALEGDGGDDPLSGREIILARVTTSTQEEEEDEASEPEEASV